MVTDVARHALCIVSLTSHSLRSVGRSVGWLVAGSFLRSLVACRKLFVCMCNALLHPSRAVRLRAELVVSGDGKIKKKSDRQEDGQTNTWSVCKLPFPHARIPEKKNGRGQGLSASDSPHKVQSVAGRPAGHSLELSAGERMAIVVE